MTTPRTRSPDPFQAPARPAHLSGVYEFGPGRFADDEEPTTPGGPQGLAYQATIIFRAYREASAADRAWFLRVIEFAAWAKEK
jgi:hypothetical protein